MNKPRPIWLNITLFLTTFLIAVIWVPYRALTHGFDSFEIIAAIACFSYCGMSITAGYHRLWSHRTYKAHASVRFLYAIGGAFALQNSILHWSSDHRVHHKHVDNNDIDPYSAKRGFWFSHIGWMLRDYQGDTYHNYDNVRDLQKQKIVTWQHRYYLPLAMITNVGIPVALGWLNGDILSAVLLIGVLRLVLSHHTTFFINSLAHVWGRQTYTDKNTARDNGFLALFTFGEGYHNFHHIFENDYRNGIRWFDFDPTKWLIQGLARVGLAEQLRTTPEDKIAKAKAAMQLKLIQQKAAQLSNAEELLQKLQTEYDLLVEQLAVYYEAKKNLLNSKRDQLAKDVEKSMLMCRYKEVKAELAERKKQWDLVRAAYA
ncbi:fatty acid desaturase [Thalassotalea ponticola]|uniref:fatty acid desaturase n=1 Tax=Thalassotalea ponticola TaxID=1523392 RepID=UPI0025B5BEF9|nr:fatty acid desaturase [Thalassotalea ponticola]MDN3653650.1 fatty acid desaturase [Thalassotalea ponticola]